MPVISMFYGVIIQMFFFDKERHNFPHIHAKYAEFTASISIETGEVLAGEIPRKQLRLVEAWIEIHKERVLLGI